MTKRCAPLVVGLLLALAAQVAVANESASGWAYDLVDEIMSPFCPGRALSECPSSQADDLRRWIVAQEKAGVPREEVEAELFQRWGDQLLQAPRAKGVGLVAYTIPAFIFAAGGALVLLFLRRQRAAASIGPAPSPLGLDPELEREVDEELGRG